MQEDTANWIFDGEREHSFSLSTVPVKFREEFVFAGNFAVEVLLPESRVNWSFPVSEFLDGEMPLCCSIKACESSLYAMAENYEERFADFCMTISHPLRETAWEDTGKAFWNNRRQPLQTFSGCNILCARYCVYRL